MAKTHDHGHTGSHGCSCCSEGLRAAWAAAAKAGVSRRNLLVGAGTAAVGSWLAGARSVAAAADQPAASRPAIQQAKS